MRRNRVDDARRRDALAARVNRSRTRAHQYVSPPADVLVGLTRQLGVMCLVRTDAAS
jgi:hypothetical protein